MWYQYFVYFHYKKCLERTLMNVWFSWLILYYFSLAIIDNNEGYYNSFQKKITSYILFAWFLTYFCNYFLFVFLQFFSCILKIFFFKNGSMDFHSFYLYIFKFFSTPDLKVLHFINFWNFVQLSLVIWIKEKKEKVTNLCRRNFLLLHKIIYNI